MATCILLRLPLFALSLLSIWTIVDLLKMSGADVLDDEETGFGFETIEQLNQPHKGKSGPMRFPKMVPDNGMFHFVLKDIANELVNILEEGGLSLSSTHKDTIHDKIESIYERSKDHPALESDLVAYSPKKPDYHQHTPDSVLKTRAQERRDKRRLFAGEIHEVCQSGERWEGMEVANLRNHTLVKVLPGLEFYMRQCTGQSEDASCRGISRRIGTSSCQTTGTWVRALVCGGCNFNTDPGCNRRCPNVRELYHWEWVYTPTCCKCAYSYF